MSKYTNSPLVSFTRLSPNHSGQRTHAIDRITPHCVVGYCTAEDLGDWFARESTRASSNYGIDKDGRVGLYVEEKNRSWCTSSSANDQRAITIECASDTKEPYSFRDATYQRLVELCVDICRRNGKNRLTWIEDKNTALNYTPADGEMQLTVHRWFANKSCPGNWMFARMGDLAAKVTAALGSSPQPQPAPDPELPAVPFQVRVIIDDLNYRSGPGMDYQVNGQTGKGTFTIVETSDGWGRLKSGAGWIWLKNPDYCTIAGAAASTPAPDPQPQATTTDGNAETIWNFLKGKGLNNYAVAGIMGNLHAESALRPENLQNTFEKSLGMTDLEYTAAVDSGRYTRDEFIHDHAGYGLAQWTYWSRKQAMYDAIKGAGKSIGDLGAQLAFFWTEIQGYTGVIKVLQAADSIREASDVVLLSYERPADQSEAVQQKRAGYGQIYYDKFAASTPEPEYQTYTVKAGDSLWAIAARFLGDGRRYPEIRELNGIASNNVIYAGQVLKIPAR